MKALMIGVGLVAIATPALADYYIIQEPTTKRCRIVEERPAPNAGVIIGGAGFGVAFGSAAPASPRSGGGFAPVYEGPF